MICVWWSMLFFWAINVIFSYLSSKVEGVQYKQKEKIMNFIHFLEKKIHQIFIFKSYYLIAHH